MAPRSTKSGSLGKGMVDEGHGGAGVVTLSFDSASRMRSPVSTCCVVWCSTKISLFPSIFPNARFTSSSLARLFNAFKARSSFEAPSDGRTLDRAIYISNTCLKVSSTTAFRAFVTSSEKRPHSAWDWMCLSVAVNKGKRIDRERSDSGTSEDLEVKSCNREKTSMVSSTREAIEATSPMAAAASAMGLTQTLT